MSASVASSGWPGVQKHQGRAQAHENDADVFDAVIGEQPLEVVFHQRVEHAEHGGNRADGEHGHAPPVRRRAEEIEEHARHAVDAGLDEHAGHERGDVARRDRVRRRQPDVQRHDARLDAEADEEKQKRRVALVGRHFVAKGVKRVKAVAARRLEQQQETKNEAARADVRHDEVKHAGVARLFLFVLEAHEAVGRQRHDFPGDEEKEGVVGEEHQRRGQQQQR